MRPRLIGEVTEKDGMLCIQTRDPGCWYPLDGNSGLAEDFREAFGRAQKGDIGKRVYNAGGVLQMENEQQRQARLVGAPMLRAKVDICRYCGEERGLGPETGSSWLCGACNGFNG